MSSLISAIDYVVIIIMLTGSSAVGVYFRFTGSRQKTLQEFLLAGRNMTVLPVAFSLMASFMSTSTMLGIPADIYLYGFQQFVGAFGIAFAGIMAAFLYLPVFYDMNVSTAYEYLEKRFGKTTRYVVSVVFCIQTILYMGVTFYAPCMALAFVTGISSRDSIILLSLVCILYCSLGGLKAVLWADVFQATLMIVSVLLIAIKGTVDIGGVTELYQIAQQGGRLNIFNFSLSPEYKYTFWNCFIFNFVAFLAIFGSNQTEIQRMLSVKSRYKAKWAMLFCLPLILIFFVLSNYNGLVLYGLFHNCDPIMRPIPDVNIETPNQLIPYAITKLFKSIPGISGLCIAGIFSASLSTVSSGLNSLAAVAAKDFIEPHCLNRIWAQKWMPIIVKFLVAGFGVLCLLISMAVGKFHGIFEAAVTLTSILMGPIFGVFNIGIFTTTGNEIGTLIGFVAGIAVNTCMVIGSKIFKPKSVQLFRNITGCSETFNLKTNVSHLNALHAYHHNISYYAENNRNIPSLYKVSFMFYSTIGCFIVCVIGYICSWIKRKYSEDNIKIKPEYISPVLRKWYFPSKVVQNEKNEFGVEMGEKNKGNTKCNK